MYKYPFKVLKGKTKFFKVFTPKTFDEKYCMHACMINEPIKQ